MKKFILLLLIPFSICNAQIVFEQSYEMLSINGEGLFFTTNIGNNNYKYVIHNRNTDQVNLYNLNHTLYTTF